MLSSLGHRHLNRLLADLGKCAASRCHVTFDSRKPDYEWQLALQNISFRAHALSG